MSVPLLVSRRMFHETLVLQGIFMRRVGSPKCVDVCSSLVIFAQPLKSPMFETGTAFAARRVYRL